ncbi:AAA family ATPase [Salinithrix halophila]|uniref:Nuclease SbcCD subunit C n=1 Tax=Salinithrix halophila TaxID=1485204 RepID=A0ABV8JHP3_9BACL
MNRFEKLVIENFQSHSRTEISFTDGLNVFVGPSDSGKSAILRALRWVLYNQPKGKDYIRVGKDRCRVVLTLTDGTEITRERSASVNRYFLKVPGKEEMIFEGFGGNVPREVIEAHGMHPLKLDSDWNMPAQFGTQLEGPFLLSETGGVKAKSIGRVSGAHLIDIALQETVRDQRNLSSEIKHVLAESERLKESLKPYQTLPDLIERLEGAEERHREASEMRWRLERLQTAKERWDGCRKQQAGERVRLERLACLPDLTIRVVELEQLCNRRERLARATDNHRRTHKEKADWKRVLAKTKNCNRLEGTLRDLEERATRHRRMESLHERCTFHQQEEEKVKRWLKGTMSVKETDLADLEERHHLFSRLIRLLPRYRHLCEEKEKLREQLRRTEALPDELTGELPLLLERLKRLTACKEELRDRRKRLRDGIRYRNERDREIRAWTEQLAAILETLGRCPTCGSPISGSALEHILEEYRGGVSGAAAGREDQRD